MTINISLSAADTLAASIAETFDKFDDARASQLDDIAAVRSAIYDTGSKNRNKNNFALPDIWELAQTLKSHLIENLYSHPEGMFDVSGADFSAQKLANAQKAMLVSYFEKMHVEDEIEKIVDSVVETGEATLLVSWETQTKTSRRAQTLEEQIVSPTDDGFLLEEKVVFDYREK